MNLSKSFPQNTSFLFKLFLSAIAIFILNISLKATTVTIAVSSNQFTPSNVNVNVGDSIKFQWMDGSHTTTCDGIFPGTSLPTGAAPWDAQMNSGSPIFIYRITVAGTYNYVCQPHAPSMAGTINAAGAGGSVFLTENFSYPVGDSLGAHGWTSFSGGSTNVLSVTSPGLTYSGYPLSNIGNATTVVASGQDAFTSMTSQIDSAAGTSVYAAFMVNVTSGQTWGDYFLAFLPSNSTTFYSGRVYAKASGGNLNFGVTKGAASDTTIGGYWSNTNFALNTTYLVVLKFKFVSGASNDLVSIFVFSSGIPATEPTPLLGPITFPSGDPGNIGRIALRQGTATRAPVAVVDGIRVANSWTGILLTSLNTISSTVPENFYLAQNYPNPFNPSTTIKFSIPERGNVNLTIFNSLGKEVGNLINSVIDAGNFSYNFNGSNLNSGIYFYRLNYTNGTGNNFIETKKLVLLK